VRELGRTEKKKENNAGHALPTGGCISQRGAMLSRFVRIIKEAVAEKLLHQILKEKRIALKPSRRFGRTRH